VQNHYFFAALIIVCGAGGLFRTFANGHYRGVIRAVMVAGMSGLLGVCVSLWVFGTPDPELQGKAVALGGIVSLAGREFYDVILSSFMGRMGFIRDYQSKRKNSKHGR